jgi:putative DNA methylase
MPKIIETNFPFAELSRIAEQESWRKEIYRPVYYINKWWARRLGSVFRGIILGALLEDNEDFWSRFYGSNDFHETTLFDPFMGSGVTIGEGIKLGCRTIGRDINAVAVTSCRAAFAQYDRKVVQDTFLLLEHTVAPKLLSLFKTKTPIGEDATVLYYFLVKIIDCPHCSKPIDLFKSRIFSKNAIPKKDPSAHAVCPKCGRIVSTQFDALIAKCANCEHVFNPQIGTISGSMVCCPECNTEFKLVDVMRLISGPLRYRRYAKMVLYQNGSKHYDEINEFDLALEREISEEYKSIIKELPQTAVQSGYNTDQMLKHNYRYWYELFSDRQIVCIRYLEKAIENIGDDKVRYLFACLFSGTLEFNNLFTSFKGEGTGAVRHMFANHVLKPELMPIEANLWGTPKSSGAFSCLYKSRIERALDYKAYPTEVVIDSYSGAKAGGFNKPLFASLVSSYEAFSKHSNNVYLSQGDSSSTDFPDGSIDLIVSDPPFFDNVHYSQLADFFYYWLNQLLCLGPETTTRSQAEVQDTDQISFANKLTGVFSECKRVLRDEGLLIFTYHHARHDGWKAINKAIRHAGFECFQSFPIKAEMTVSIPLQQAKSPIHLDLILVCRKNLHNSLLQDKFDPLSNTISKTASQIKELTESNISVSLADAKVILMGQLLCQLHKTNCPDIEETYLNQIDHNIDVYIASVMAEQDENFYKIRIPQQLSLFEEMGTYLINREKP